MNKHYKNWLLLAPIGLVLVGMGACFLTEAALLKYAGATPAKWVMAGTGALVVFNTGLSLFGTAIVSRVRYLQEKE